MPREAGRVAAGRDEDDGPVDDDGRELVDDEGRGAALDARGVAGRAVDDEPGEPVDGVFAADVRAVARRGGALGDAGRRGADMRSILPRPEPRLPDPAPHGRAGAQLTGAVPRWLRSGPPRGVHPARSRPGGRPPMKGIS